VQILEFSKGWEFSQLLEKNTFLRTHNHDETYGTLQTHDFELMPRYPMLANKCLIRDKLRIFFTFDQMGKL
jgi:hypothetical protein